MATRREKKFRGTNCLNCDTALDISEKYCHQCGQLNSTKKITIKDFFEEFLSNFYAYDSRLRNSILSIFTKPGVLAYEYNAGKRQRYANPFRLFLSISLLLFLIFSIKNKEFNNLKNEEITINTDKIEKANINIDELNLEDTASANLIKKSLSKIQNDTIIHSVDSIYRKEYIDQYASLKFDPLKYTITSFRNYHLKYPNTSDTKSLQNLGYENNHLNRFLFNKAKLFKTNNVYEEIFDYFYKKLPFLIFLSLPIITLIFWIVYYSKNINYTEHLVFSYTFFSFMFICLILFHLIELISPDLSTITILLCFLIIFPIYFYKSLRNFYQESRWKTIFKFVILNPLFVLFLIISATLMMFLGILLF